MRILYYAKPCVVSTNWFLCQVLYKKKKLRTKVSSVLNISVQKIYMSRTGGEKKYLFSK